MGERVEQVQKMIKSFENTQKRIMRKYNQANIKNEIKDIDNILGDIESNLKVKDLHIKRLEEELNQVSSSERDLVEEYKNAIEKAKNEYEEEKQNSEMQKYIDKKEELSIKLQSDKSNNEKLIKQEVRNAEDKLRANLTQEGMKLDNEINKVELNMKLTLADMNDFKYQYEEKDGVRVATNGDEYRKINEKYEALKMDLVELKDAKQLCESKLQEFKDRDAKKTEKFSKAWNESKNNEEENKNTNVKEAKTEEYKPNFESAQEKFEDLKNKYRLMKNGIKQNEEEPKEAEKVKNEEEVDNAKDIDVKNDLAQNQEENILNNEMHGNKLEELQMNNDLIRIVINEKMNGIFVKLNDKENNLPIMKNYNLQEILKDKRKLFKENNINEIVKKLCDNNRMKSFLLARRVNPAVIKALEDDKEMQETYIKCLKDKKELPFEMIHDLRNSKLGFLDRMSMRICAKAEDKIPGTKITFAERFWNKNKALPKGEKQNIVDEKDEILEGKYKQVGKEQERNMKEEIKVDNKDNRIEEEANRVIEETEAKRAEDIKKFMNENSNKEK